MGLHIVLERTTWYGECTKTIGFYITVVAQKPLAQTAQAEPGSLPLEGNMYLISFSSSSPSASTSWHLEADIVGQAVAVQAMVVEVAATAPMDVPIPLGKYKHKKRSLRWIMEHDKDYLLWCITNDFHLQHPAFWEQLEDAALFENLLANVEPFRARLRWKAANVP